ENAVRTVIHHYTKESGVRSLEREIASICRKLARQVVKEGKGRAAEGASAEEARIVVDAKAVPKLLGVPKFRLSRKEERDEVGLVKGLAWMTTGGDVLEAEAMVVPGKGKLIITGRLEKGMEESGQAA